ncbi:MAG: hypothetical protein GY820_12385 [Gammaproteobacteria bacterium]|nr:hypothetical protein [Gammaproteobacteria bacterium]
MKNIIFSLLSLALAFPIAVNAGYDSNMDGKVEKIITYTSGEIYIIMENQPSAHPVCDHSFFSIDRAIPSDIRHQLLSRALTAYATKETIRIGYDGLGDCVDGKIRIHRIG